MELSLFYCPVRRFSGRILLRELQAGVGNRNNRMVLMCDNRFLAGLDLF
jgi:hypothetical protein